MFQNILNRVKNQRKLLQRVESYFEKWIRVKNGYAREFYVQTARTTVVFAMQGTQIELLRAL